MAESLAGLIGHSGSTPLHSSPFFFCSSLVKDQLQLGPSGILFLAADLSIYLIQLYPGPPPESSEWPKLSPVPYLSLKTTIPHGSLDSARLSRPDSPCRFLEQSGDSSLDFLNPRHPAFEPLQNTYHADPGAYRA